MTGKLTRFLGAAMLLCAGISYAVAADRYENIHIANGLATAEVGDWVLFKLPDGKTQKHTVIERTGSGEDAKAVVQIVDFKGNIPVFSQKQTSPAGEEFVQPPMPKGKKYSFARRKETVDFDGSAVEVTIVDVYEGDTKMRTWYLSTEFPVYGVMRRINEKGSAEIDLVTFGIGDAKTDPYVFPAAPKPAPAAAAPAAPPAPPPAAAAAQDDDDDEEYEDDEEYDEDEEEEE